MSQSSVSSPVPQPEPAPGDATSPGPDADSVTDAVPPRCETRTRLYCSGRVELEGFPAEDIRGLLDRHDDAVVWLDLYDPDQADLQIVVKEFGLHPLAVEDAVHDHQRPKLDRYPTHLFANMYAVQFDSANRTLRTSEISAFITAQALITVRKADFDVDVLLRRWDEAVDLAEAGVAFLVHGLLDAVVDGHDLTVRHLDDAVDGLEDLLFEPARAADVRRQSFELRRAITRLRRVVLPMRDLVARLERADTHFVTERMRPYFQDVDDHVLRAGDGVEGASARIANVLDTAYNEQGNDLNVITRKLAAWAAIIAVPTAVTGWYGQNVPYPGFDKLWGFFVSTAVIVVFAGGLYVALRRKGWL